MRSSLLSHLRDILDLFFGKGFNNPYLLQNSKGIGLDVNRYLKSPEGRQAFLEAGRSVERGRER